MENLKQERKKVAILTLHDENNYGNRYQNYAVQELCEELGFEVETIINHIFFQSNFTSNRKNRIKSILKLSFQELIGIIFNKVWMKINSKEIEESKKTRALGFNMFSKNLKFSKYNISENNVPNQINTYYDYVIVGSDQVWNPYIKQDFRIYLLPFIDYNKRIAISPSFGVTSIPENFKSIYRESLLNFGNLSVREEAGRKIIEELTGIDVKVLVDPTMMLGPSKWLSVSTPVSYIDKRDYLLSFFIGNKSSRYKKFIKRIAKKKKLEVISIGRLKDLKYYSVSPSELISLINSSKYICTDSYHIAIFSILFHKQFLVFPRMTNGVSMNSRIDTLLKKFSLESRYIENYDFHGENAIRYDVIDKIMADEREKFAEYLRLVFNLV